MATSEAQKRAQRKYDKNKTKTMTIKYTFADMEDYYEFKKYLEENDKTANKIMKELIHNFLKTKDTKQAQTFNDGLGLMRDCYMTNPYRKINPDTIAYLNKHIGASGTEELLLRYRTIAESHMITEYTEKFERFVNVYIKQYIDRNPSINTLLKRRRVIELVDRHSPEMYHLQ